MADVVEKVDDFIGKKFGKEGQLTVTGWDGSRTGGKSGGARIYTLVCTKCAKDPEMFGKGEFKSTKGQLVKGRVPCGCGTMRWNIDRYEVKIKRICEDLNYRFISFLGKWQKDETKVHIACDHGHSWISTNAGDFVQGKTRCPTCHKEKRRVAALTTDENLIKSFIATGKFKEGTEFWKSDRRDSKGNLSYFKYRCKSCGEDEYFKAGVGRDVFEGFSAQLSAGSLPCRCSNHYHHTKDEREYDVKKILKEEGSKLEFVGWEGEYNRTKSKILLRCETHGTHPVILSYFLGNSRSRCPLCANKGGYDKSKVGYVYILLAEGISTSFTGFGISNKPKSRFYTHKRNLAKEGLSITYSQVFETHGEIAPIIEKEIKTNFKIVTQDISGFRQEATHNYSYTEVVEFVRLRSYELSKTNEITI